MSDLAICRRYAAALQAEAESRGVVDQVDDDVAMTRQTLTDSRELILFFASPVISTDKKRAIIELLFSERVTELFLRFLLLLNEKGRGHMIEDVLSEYRTLRNRRLGIVEAKARAAISLSQAEVDALTSKLSKLVNADIELDVAQDASLLGGVVVRVGDTVYDGSLKRRLSVLKTQLEGGSFLRN